MLARRALGFISTRAFSTSRAQLDISRVTLIGRLGNDPIQRETASGKPYYVYTVATATGAPGVDQDGNRTEPPTSWHNIFAFNEGSFRSLQRAGKGSTVFVEADLEMRAGGTASDGTPLPDKPLLRHRSINIINRLKPLAEEEVAPE
ncbi:ssDNA-binding protein, mitochondrial [Cryptotrichosporon argae]